MPFRRNSRKVWYSSHKWESAWLIYAFVRILLCCPYVVANRAKLYSILNIRQKNNKVKPFMKIILHKWFELKINGIELGKWSAERDSTAFLCQNVIYEGWISDPMVKFFTMTKSQTLYGRPVYFLNCCMSYFGRRLIYEWNIVGKCGEYGLFDERMKFGKWNL